MSVKPVAWLYSRRHLNDAKGDVVTLNPASPLIEYGWTETPLYSAPAPELAEALQALLDASDCPQYNAAKDAAISLLARITPK